MSHLSLPHGCSPKCTACAHRSLPYESSRDQKLQFLTEALHALRLRDSTLPPVHWHGASEESRWGTRDKAVLHVRPSENGTHKPWTLGLLGPRVTRDWNEVRPLISLRECPQHSSMIREIHTFLETLPVCVAKFPWKFAVISSRILTLVLKSSQLPDPETLKTLQQLPWASLPLTGVYLNLHAACGDRVLDPKRFSLIWGDATAVHTPTQFSSLPYSYGPSSFGQAHSELHAQSIVDAKKFLITPPADRYLDLYSGIGLTLREWSHTGRPSLGIELSRESLQLAQKNAPQAMLLQGKCEERLPQIKDFTASHVVHAYCNPPRMGMAPELTKWINEERPLRKLAYLSCSPKTLARDLQALTQWRVCDLHAYDFFPNTYHQETLVLLERYSETL